MTHRARKTGCKKYRQSCILNGQMAGFRVDGSTACISQRTTKFPGKTDDGERLEQGVDERCGAGAGQNDQQPNQQ
jgi:hypothetical protein